MFIFIFAFCDAAVNYQLLIQDPATGCLGWMANFYDLIMAYLALVLAIIFFLITVLLADSMHHKSSNSYFSHPQSLEILRTVVPALVLLSIAYSSFNLFCYSEGLIEPLSELIVEPCVSGETEKNCAVVLVFELLVTADLMVYFLYY